jgi:hypothetical protein
MNAASRVGTVVTQHPIIRQLIVRGSGTSDSRDPVAPLLQNATNLFHNRTLAFKLLVLLLLLLLLLPLLLLTLLLIT